MDRNQEGEGEEGHRQGHPERDGDDGGVGHQVADHGNEAGEEGHGQKRPREGQRGAEERQHDEEIDPGEDRVQGRDLQLGHHDALEGDREAPNPLPERRREGCRSVGGRVAVMEEDEQADDHAHEGVEQEVPEGAAQVAELGRVGAEPFGGGDLDPAVREQLVDERRADAEAEELGPGLVEDVGDLLEESGQVADRAAHEPEEQEHEASGGTRSDEREDGEGQELRGAPGHAGVLEEARRLVQQGVDDEARKKPADEAEVEDEEQGPGHEDPGRLQDAGGFGQGGGQGLRDGCGHFDV